MRYLEERTGESELEAVQAIVDLSDVVVSSTDALLPEIKKPQSSPSLKELLKARNITDDSRAKTFALAALPGKQLENL